MPIDYRKYPKEWSRIRLSVLERAKNHCEWCGVRNDAAIERHKKNSSIYRYPHAGNEFLDKMPGGWFDPIRVVLTIAHLDHDPKNNTPGNLVALCQRCHLRYDGPLHKHNATRTKAAKKENGVWLVLFEGRDGGHEVYEDAAVARKRFDGAKTRYSVRLFCQVEESVDGAR